MAKQNNPSQMTDAVIHFDNESFAGSANKIDLPDIELITKDVTASGQGGESAVIIKKLKKMVVKPEIEDYSSKLLGFLGKKKKLTFYGSMNRDGDEKSVKAVITAEWFKQVTGKGDSSSQDIKLPMEGTVKKYELHVEGEEVYYIDIENDICRIAGEDLFEAKRKNLGGS